MIEIECGLVSDSSLELERVAATVRLARDDADRFLELLAGRLQTLVPGLVTIRRRGLRNRRVEQVTVALPDQRLTISRAPTGVDTTLAQVVRGIVVATHQLTVEEWVQRLAQAVAAQAASQDQARTALERLLALE
jgi:hypothetical protein